MNIGGGMGEEYMHAPSLNVGGGEKGKGHFFAMILDALGIQHQVAKEPKGDKKSKDSASGQEASPAGKVTATGGAPAFTPMMDGQGTAPAAAPPPPGLTILDDAATAFQPMTPQASKYGMGLSFLPRTLR